MFDIEIKTAELEFYGSSACYASVVSTLVQEVSWMWSQLSSELHDFDAKSTSVTHLFVRAKLCFFGNGTATEWDPLYAMYDTETGDVLPMVGTNILPLLEAARNWEPQRKTESS